MTKQGTLGELQMVRKSLESVVRRLGRPDEPLPYLLPWRMAAVELGLTLGEIRRMMRHGEILSMEYGPRKQKVIASSEILRLRAESPIVVPSARRDVR